MNPLLLTFLFLALLAALTVGDVKRFTSTATSALFAGKAHERMAYVEAAREKARLTAAREAIPPEERQTTTPKVKQTVTKTKMPKSKPAKSRPLNFDLATPPNNSRINFYILLQNEEKTESQSFYQIAARLIRKLHPTLQPGLENALLDALIAVKEKTADFTSPDELATLALDDAMLHDLFYEILTGSRNAKKPLLHFITFDKPKTASRIHQKINILFADPLLLSAIFDNEAVTSKFLSCRDALWERIIKEEKNRAILEKDECITRKAINGQIKEALETALTSSGLASENYMNLFEYSLGHPGTVLFVEDPITGLKLRERLL